MKQKRNGVKYNMYKKQNFILMYKLHKKQIHINKISKTNTIYLAPHMKSMIYVYPINI